MNKIEILNLLEGYFNLYFDNLFAYGPFCQEFNL